MSAGGTARYTQGACGSARYTEGACDSARQASPYRVAVVVAGGSGTRMRDTAQEDRTAGFRKTADGKPAGASGAVKKQYLDLGGKPLMTYALLTLEQSAMIDAVVIVVSPGDEDFVRREIVARYGFRKVRNIVPGGRERYHSVYEGLCAVARLCAGDAQNREETNGEDDGLKKSVLSATADDTLVFIQDAARPFLTEDILRRVYDGALRYGACVAAMPVKDTIKQADENGFVTATPDRKTLWAIQTPQTFRFSVVREAYSRLIAEEDAGADLSGVTDDAMVVERYMPGYRVFIAKGDYGNIKVTTPEDLEAARGLVRDKGGDGHDKDQTDL